MKKWSDIEKELFTADEIRESRLRVAAIGELITARQEKSISQWEPENRSDVKQPIISHM